MPAAKQTLCWDCENSWTGDCEWSRHLKPVPGWEAEETKKQTIGKTYCVIECPKFKRDSWKYGEYRTIEEYAEYLSAKEKRDKQAAEREERRREQAHYHRKPDERPGVKKYTDWSRGVQFYGRREPEEED